MEPALTAQLLAATGLTAVVGQRITWGRRDQGGALPAIVLHRVDGGRDYHMAGASGLVESRVQADCWGATKKTASQAAAALEAAVSGARFNRAGIRFDLIMIADERSDTFDEAGSALFRTSLDLIIHHALAA